MKGLLKLSVLLSVIALSACASHKNGSSPPSLYKDVKAKEIAYTSYDRVMQAWPVEYKEVWVDTDYGSTHIIVSGPEHAKPVFLLPGLFADATMWYANVGALAQHYRVYSLDQITYGGKSEPSGKIVADVQDYVVWFKQIIKHFNCDKVAVAGLSYGSWLSLALAREIPDTIAAIIMLDPSETFIKMDGGIAWRGFWDFMFFPNRNKYRRFFAWMGGGYSSPTSDIWLEHMLDVIEFGSVGMFDIPQHRIYHAEDLTMINMPVLIMAGGKPIVYKDPHAFATAAAKALPHAEVVVVPGTGHSLNVEKAEKVNKKMLDFLLQNYQSQR